ncbi:MAG: hypothetical protein ACK4UN_10960, partial [Limisphaerales bacterium]
MHQIRHTRLIVRYRLKLVLSVVCFFASCVTPTLAATYYVSPAGNNNYDGLSPETAWQGIDKVNTIAFQPGDSILFAGGETFSGNVYFDSEDRGTSQNPITVGSFGIGRATINAGMEAGFYAYNTAGVVIRDLNFVGAGPRQNTKNGITFLTDLPGD